MFLPDHLEDFKHRMTEAGLALLARLERESDPATPQATGAPQEARPFADTLPDWHAKSD